MLGTGEGDRLQVVFVAVAALVAVALVLALIFWVGVGIMKVTEAVIESRGAMRLVSALFVTSGVGAYVLLAPALLIVTLPCLYFLLAWFWVIVVND